MRLSSICISAELAPARPYAGCDDSRATAAPVAEIVIRLLQRGELVVKLHAVRCGRVVISGEAGYSLAVTGSFAAPPEWAQRLTTILRRYAPAGGE